MFIVTSAATCDHRDVCSDLVHRDVCSNFITDHAVGHFLGSFVESPRHFSGRQVIPDNCTPNVHSNVRSHIGPPPPVYI